MNTQESKTPFYTTSAGTLVVQNMIGKPLAAPWWRKAVGIALGYGCYHWKVVKSSRAFSGAVIRVGFNCFGKAAKFATSWSGWVGFPIAVSPRKANGKRIWVVFLPCNAPLAKEATTPGAVEGKTKFYKGG